MFPKMFTSDGNHVSILGHAQVAYMIIRHLRQLMLSIRDNVSNSKEVKVTVAKYSLPLVGDVIILPDCPLNFRDLPEPMFKSYQQYFRDHPFCFTLMTPDINKKMSLDLR